MENWSSFMRYSHCRHIERHYNQKYYFPDKAYCRKVRQPQISLCNKLFSPDCLRHHTDVLSGCRCGTVFSSAKILYTIFYMFFLEH